MRIVTGLLHVSVHADGETFVLLKALGLLLVNVGRTQSCLGTGGDGGKCRDAARPQWHSAGGPAAG